MRQNVAKELQAVTKFPACKATPINSQKLKKQKFQTVITSKFLSVRFLFFHHEQKATSSVLFQDIQRFFDGFYLLSENIGNFILIIPVSVLSLCMTLFWTQSVMSVRAATILVATSSDVCPESMTYALYHVFVSRRSSVITGLFSVDE